MDDFHCSFCGRRRREVQKLISGPRVFICNHCVAGFRKSFDEQFPPPPRPARPFPSPTGRRLTDEERGSYLSKKPGYWNEGALARAYGVELTDPRGAVAPEVLALLPSAVAWQWGVVPLERIGPNLRVAMDDPSDGIVIAAVMEATGLEVEATLARTGTIRGALVRHYPRRATPSPERDCSFCGKPAAQLAMVLHMPSAGAMCDECLLLCEDIIAEDLGPNVT